MLIMENVERSTASPIPYMAGEIFSCQFEAHAATTLKQNKNCGDTVNHRESKETSRCIMLHFSRFYIIIQSAFIFGSRYVFATSHTCPPAIRGPFHRNITKCICMAENLVYEGICLFLIQTNTGWNLLSIRLKSSKSLIDLCETFILIQMPCA